MGNFTLGKYMPLNSVIHKLDPRAKILAMLLVLIAIFFPAGWIGYVLIFAVASITVLASKLSFKFIFKALKPMMFMLIFLGIINLFAIKTGTLLFSIGSFGIYSGAITQTLYIAFRLMLMIMITTSLTATTKPLDLTLGIEDLLAPFDKMGVPSHEIAMLISIALRFIPDLIDETQRIMKAQTSRGVDLQEGSFMEKINAILSLIVPLFVSAFQRAEDLANAMEARGYAPGEKRTRYKQLQMVGKDYLFMAAAGCVLVACIVLSIVL